MRVSNYSVLISDGIEKDSGHVFIEHGKIYNIRLGNHDHSRRCDALVEVDGKDVGSFRLDIGRTIVLEHPLNDKGCFTFFKSESEQAVAAGIGNVAVDNRGLIRVTFKPEKRQYPSNVSNVFSTPTSYSTRYNNGETPTEYTKGPSTLRSAGGIRPCSLTPDCCSVSGSPLSEKVTSGITGLTGHSNQEFTTVAFLDYDASLETIITLRLVSDNVVREVKPVLRMNPIPATVS